MSERDQMRREREPGTPPSQLPSMPSDEDKRPRTAGEADRFPNEDFDLPAWRSYRERRQDRDRLDDSERRQPDAPGGTPSSTQRRDRVGPRREPLPTLGDAFQRPPGDRAPDARARSSAATRDPYERLRRVPAQPRRRVTFDDEADGDLVSESAYDDDLAAAYGELQPARRERLPSRSFQRTPSRGRPPAAAQLGGLLAAAGPQARLVGLVGGFALLSLVLMGATVAGRVGSLPDWIAIHLNAEGSPDRWGTATTIWRVPFMALMASLMSAVVGWYLWTRDPFAARLALGSVILLHALCWIALVNLVW